MSYFARFLLPAVPASILLGIYSASLPEYRLSLLLATSCVLAINPVGFLPIRRIVILVSVVAALLPFLASILILPGIELNRRVCSCGGSQCLRVYETFEQFPDGTIGAVVIQERAWLFAGRRRSFDEFIIFVEATDEGWTVEGESMHCW